MQMRSRFFATLPENLKVRQPVKKESVQESLSESLHDNKS